MSQKRKPKSTAPSPSSLGTCTTGNETTPSSPPSIPAPNDQQTFEGPPMPQGTTHSPLPASSSLSGSPVGKDIGRKDAPSPFGEYCPQATDAGSERIAKLYPKILEDLLLFVDCLAKILLATSNLRCFYQCRILLSTGEENEAERLEIELDPTVPPWVRVGAAVMKAWNAAPRLLDAIADPRFVHPTHLPIYKLIDSKIQEFMNSLEFKMEKYVEDNPQLSNPILTLRKRSGTNRRVVLANNKVASADDPAKQLKRKKRLVAELKKDDELAPLLEPVEEVLNKREKMDARAKCDAIMKDNIKP